MKGDKNFLKKNLIIKQHDVTDCGPACLLSVILYYGGFVPLNIIRDNCFTDKSGTSCFNLINCAKKYGLTGSGIRVDDINSIEKKNLPCIAHVRLENGLNHFVTIYEINQNNVILMDPAIGKVKMRQQEFNKIFSGIIVLLHPYKKIEKLDRPKSIKKLVTQMLLNNKIEIVFLFFISIFTIIISIILNYYIKIGDLIINNKIGVNYLYALFIVYLALYIFRDLFNYIRNIIIIKLNKNVSYKLFYDFSKKIFNLPLSFIRSRTSGEIISRYHELSEINDMLPSMIISVILDLVMSFVTLIFLIIISKELALIVLVQMLIYFIVAYTFKNPTLCKINKNLDANANLNSNVIESINNLRSIKNLHNESNIRKKLERVCSKTIENNYSIDKFYSRVSLVKNLFYNLMIFLVTTYGLYLLYFGKINVVNLFTFLMVTNYFSEPVKDLVDLITKFCFIKTSINKISEFNIIEDENKGKLKFVQGDILINNLSYAYNGIDYVIKNYSCFIKDKSKVLLKGNSGSGKSTLCQLISKQITNYEGSLYIADNEVNDINTESLRNNITYIGQKDTLIVDTIENNIIYERNIDKKEFNTICKICEIDKITNNKFNQFNNLISESSDNISGGERQRITLARGLINSGNILILDEALSEVNKDMEQRIIKRILKYFCNKTIIYVSHRNYDNLFEQTIRV